MGLSTKIKGEKVMKVLNFLLSLVLDNIFDTDIIKKRIAQIKDSGFDGIVLAIRHSGESGCLSKEFFDTLSEIILYIKSQNLSVWIGIRSGEKKTVSVPVIELCRIAMSGDGEVVKINEPGTPSPFYEVSTYERIGNVYEEIKAALSGEPFDYVSGFCAEFSGFSKSGSPSLPWYDGIEEEFRTDYGIDINPFLKELFVESEPSKFKARYLSRITARFTAATVVPLSEWCAQNDKEFFMTSDMEFSPINTVEERGSYLESERKALVPAISVKSPDDINIFSAASASGLARQRGGTQAAASMFGGTGWGLSPEAFEECIRKLVECGISTFVINSCYPRLNYEVLRSRHISFPAHIPWRGAIPGIFDRMRKLAEIEQNRPRRILLVCPTRAMWRSYTPGGENRELLRLSEAVTGISERLYEMSRRFDVIDEAMFERKASFDGAGVVMGEKSYSTLLITPGCEFTKKGKLRLEKAKANGTRILNDIPKSDTEIIPLELIRNSLKEIVPIAVNQDNWTITLPENNALPLTPGYEDGKAEMWFNATEDYSEKTCLLVTDACGAVSINDILVSRKSSDERGAYYDLTNNIVAGANKIVIDECEKTFAYLLGGFKVEAAAGYRGFDGRQVQTKGKFFVRNAGIESETNLVRCGYPFALGYVSAKKIVYIEENINRPILRLRCDDVSIIEVYFDNEFIGYIYGENNTLRVPAMAADEQHVIEIRCYPSGFNLRGDRMYVFGDTGRAVSPDNPGYVRDDNIKLVNWKIPREIELIQEF